VVTSGGNQRLSTIDTDSRVRPGEFVFAENMQASLIWRNSRPSHFVRPAAAEMTEIRGKAA